MNSSAGRRAVLFDIDGTLVDSNYLQVQAWSDAFASVGRDVDRWRIHRSIALDAAKLLTALLGDDDATRLGDRAKAAHAAAYHELTGQLRPFAGARDLVQRLAERGIAVVLATSAPEDELAVLRQVLDVDRWLTAVTSSEDADTAKPEPELIEVALHRADVDAANAILVGDTVWDGRASNRAGVRFVGVRSGGIGEAELRDAGAAEVFDDPAHILRSLDSGPLAELLPA
jgi:HAD superfamily hydrolase (TIGR01549 family)